MILRAILYIVMSRSRSFSRLARHAYRSYRPRFLAVAVCGDVFCYVAATRQKMRRFAAVHPRYTEMGDGAQVVRRSVRHRDSCVEAAYTTMCVENSRRRPGDTGYEIRARRTQTRALLRLGADLEGLAELPGNATAERGIPVSVLRFPDLAILDWRIAGRRYLVHTQRQLPIPPLVIRPQCCRHAVWAELAPAHTEGRAANCLIAA